MLTALGIGKKKLPSGTLLVLELNHRGMTLRDRLARRKLNRQTKEQTNKQTNAL
jgi:uncharacterized small protein (DUF1192 family)